MSSQNRDIQYFLKARVKEFGVPPIHDGLVLGRQSPIGCAAIRKSIELLGGDPFEHIEIDDDTISDIIVRASVLRRAPRERFVSFVLERIKPLMSATEIIHLDVDVEVIISDDGA